MIPITTVVYSHNRRLQLTQVLKTPPPRFRFAPGTFFNLFPGLWGKKNQTRSPVFGPRKVI